jgi:hypothetical protein
MCDTPVGVTRLPRGDTALIVGTRHCLDEVEQDNGACQLDCCSYLWMRAPCRIRRVYSMVFPWQLTAVADVVCLVYTW